MRNKIIVEWDMPQSSAADEVREGLYEKIHNTVRAAMGNADDAHQPPAIYMHAEHEVATEVLSLTEPAFIKP